MELLDKKIKEANTRLKSSNTGVSIERQGGRLVLRAMLPPKPNSLNIQNSQQRLFVSHANVRGLKMAESKAKEVGALLEQEKFKWEVYQPELIKKTLKISEWLDLFKEDYFSTRADTPETHTTWEIDYFRPLKKLPSEQDLSVDFLKKNLLKTTKPDTRTRKRYCLAYSKLADFA